MAMADGEATMIMDEGNKGESCWNGTLGEGMKKLKDGIQGKGSLAQLLFVGEVLKIQRQRENGGILGLRVDGLGGGGMIQAREMNGTQDRQWLLLGGVRGRL
ncbi:unnamed protein product [Calypogeia fissa]